MIVTTLNANSGYDITALNAKEIYLFRKLIIMHIDQEAYIYIYMIYEWQRHLGFHSNFFSLLLILLKLSIYMFFFFFSSTWLALRIIKYDFSMSHFNRTYALKLTTKTICGTNWKMKRGRRRWLHVFLETWFR